LCGIYTKDIYDKFKSLIEERQYSMQKLVNQFTVNIIDQNDLENIDVQHELSNINTLSDLNASNL